MSRVMQPVGGRLPSAALGRDVGIFMLLAYLFSWAWWGGVMGMGIISPANLSQASGEEAQMAQILIALGNFGPLLSAVIMRIWISREGLRGSMGWRRSGWLYLAAVIAPVIFYAGVALLNHLSGIAPFVWANAEMPLWSYLAIELLIGGLIISLFIVGEEYGWRGYLLPKLLPLGEVRATVMVGLIWAGWHLPLLAAGLNYPGQSLWLAIPLFTLVVIALSFPLTWFYRLTGGSVVLVSLLHGFINSYGDGLTAEQVIPTGNSLVTGSAGLVALGILLLMIGVVYGIFKRPVVGLILAGLLLSGLPAHAQEATHQPAAMGLAIVVNSTGDEYDADDGDGICDITGKRWVADSYSGICTLRAAIQTANYTPALDTITFSGPMTIQPPNLLLAIHQPVFIDGGGQVILDGSLLGNNAGLAVYTNGGGSTIQGFTIRAFKGWGILVADAVGGSTVRDNILRENGVGVSVGGNSPNNLIEENTIILSSSNGVYLSSDGNIVRANQIGTDGSAALGNGGHGIYVALASHNVIGGAAIGVGGACSGGCNLISGNGGSGVRITQGTDKSTGVENTVRGNFIGTNRAGTAAIPNGQNGVTISGDANTVRGNLISGNGTEDHYNGFHGVYLSAGATANRVTGNLIGTAIDGKTPLGNRGAGINLNYANQNIIGGGEAARLSAPPASCAGDCNVILGNRAGITITQAISPGENRVTGNFIGVAADGASAPGNRGNGLFTNGMTTTVTANVIGGNDGHGIEVLGVGVGSPVPNNFHTIQANHIGVGPDGETDMGNRGHGVLIVRSSQNWIGGEEGGEGNIIAYNGFASGEDGGHDGVVIIASGSPYAATGNRILGNSIHSNGIHNNGIAAGIGIDLEGDGPSTNYDGDEDEGANRLQNWPRLTLVSGATVQGELNSLPNTAFRVEFFASERCSETGFGQGEEFLGSLDVTTDGDGLVSFTGALTSAPGRRRLTATATDPEGNTSEFSACYNALVVNDTGDAGDATLDGFCDTGQLNSAGDPACTLRAALQEANATPERETIAFAIPAGSAPRIMLQSALPDATQPVILDGSSQPQGRVVLDGTNAGAGVDGLRFLAGGSGAQGLTVTNFGGNGLVILPNPERVAARPDQGPTLTDLIVEGNTGAGMVSSVDTTLTDVIVRNNGGDGIGVLISLWSNSATEGLTLLGTANQIVGNGGDGIRTSPGHVRIQGGTQITGNTGWGILAGGSVIIGDGAMQRIHDNDGGGIFSSGAGAGVGIFSLPAGFIVENNGGPGLVSSVDTTLTDVIVRNNGGDGIGVLISLWSDDATEGLTLLGTANQIVGNGGHGIHTGPGHVRIQGVTQISGNTGWGILANGRVTIADGAMQRIHHNDGGGIQANEGLRLPPDFTVEENGGPGLVSVNRDLYLERITVRGNGGDGIGVVSGDLTLRGAEISANDGYGIWARNGDALRLNDVTVQGSGLSGIRADDMSLDARWLFLDQNDGSGLVITGPRAVIHNGRISRNGEYGILAVDTGVNLLSVSVWGNGRAGVQLLSGGGRSGDVAQAAASRSTVTGSEIRNNGGTGIFYNAGPAGLTVGQSHLQEDGGQALVNGDPTVTVMAQGNWWGPIPDPAGVISGRVDYAAWRSTAFDLLISPAESQFALSAGEAITNEVGLRNFATPGDSLTVLITDTLGWVTGPTLLDIPLNEDMGGSLAVTLTAAGDALPGTVNRVRITATSEQYPPHSAWTEFEVWVLGSERIYLPAVVK